MESNWLPSAVFIPYQKKRETEMIVIYLLFIYESNEKEW